MGNARSGCSVGDSNSVLINCTVGRSSSAGNYNDLGCSAGDCSSAVVEFVGRHSSSAAATYNDSEFSRTGSKVEECAAIKYIERGPGYPVAGWGFDELCEFANYIRMTPSQAYHLNWLVGEKKKSIPYYACTMKKTFVAPHNRMFFSVYFTSTYIVGFIDQSAITIKCKLGRIRIKDTIKLKMVASKHGTVRSNWSRFAAAAELKVGDICIFEFQVKKGVLSLRMHAL